MFGQEQWAFASHKLTEHIQNKNNTYHPLNTKQMKTKLRALQECMVSKPATEIQRQDQETSSLAYASHLYSVRIQYNF